MARKPRASTHRSSARFLARVLPGAVPARQPGFIAPCEPKLRRTPPTGERWLSEIKHDGYRVQAHLETGRPRLFTRRGYDWTPRFAALASALTALPANNLILDGEVIVQGETGAADFRPVPFRGPRELAQDQVLQARGVPHHRLHPRAIAGLEGRAAAAERGDGWRVG